MKLGIIGILLTGIGLTLLAYANFFAYSGDDAKYQSNTESFATTATLPVRILSAKAGIDAPVTIGGYENGKWILSKSNALFLPTSKMLGEGGNTILYAHKKKGLFATLKDLSVNDTITIYDLNGKTYTYEVYEKENIKPTQMEKIETNKTNTLTLFTCDGWFDEDRLVVKASLI